MTDQEIKDNGYHCGFFGTTAPCLAHLTAYERELWDAAFDEGRRDELECAAEADGAWREHCSVYGHDSFF
jgi:hypothetical protein